MEHDRKKVSIQLSGWKAVVGIALLLGFLGFRTFGDRTVSDTELLAALRMEIEVERTRHRLPDLKDAVRHRSEAATAAVAQEIADKIEFVEVLSSKKIVSAITDDEVTVKVRYRWPRDGKKIIERYYDVERQGFNSWYVRHEVGKWSFLLSRF